MLTTTAALASDNADWNNRTTTSLDPLLDAAGNTFTTDRGHTSLRVRRGQLLQPI